MISVLVANAFQFLFKATDYKYDFPLISFPVTGLIGELGGDLGRALDM